MVDKEGNKSKDENIENEKSDTIKITFSNLVNIVLSLKSLIIKNANIK